MGIWEGERDKGRREGDGGVCWSVLLSWVLSFGGTGLKPESLLVVIFWLGALGFVIHELGRTCYGLLLHRLIPLDFLSLPSSSAFGTVTR